LCLSCGYWLIGCCVDRGCCMIMGCCGCTGCDIIIGWGWGCLILAQAGCPLSIIIGALESFLVL
jgi:hypothetical protein